jgi:type II secretory ATPase GspE/PulE/Tfp pilus assembly ATPase PilB-like protein
MTFAKAMRASLRLDPDVIMVGEIRDEESACIAQKAGTSGHMVLSTVHSNSSPESITRLLSFGLKGFEVSSVLSAVVAQRLVKCIAPGSDLAWEPPTDVEREWLTKRGLHCPTMRLPRVIEGELAGMIPLVEMIEITDEIRRFLEAGEGDIATWVPRIMEMAIEQEQFETLAQAGVRLVLEGKTTLAEVVTAIRDGSYTPTRLRWEQRLTYQGILNVSDLERVKREIHERRMEGKIVDLKEVLLHQGLCTEQHIEMAIRETEVAEQE